jgi:hypothetical protein
MTAMGHRRLTRIVDLNELESIDSNITRFGA